MVLCLSIAHLFDANVISVTFDMPFISEELEENVNPQFIGNATTDHSGQTNLLTTVPWLSILLVIYFSGVFVLLCREAISFFRLLIMIVRSEKIKKGKYTICRITDRHTAPFSWSKYIFLRDLEVDITSSILIHEKAHTDKWHWIDVLFADLFCIILWYNPFAWMTRKLMKLNHEFEADNAVINSGVDIYAYQRLLVIKAMDRRAFPFSNSFAADIRSFRKRVLIMSKKSSSRKPMIIAILTIPALLVSEVIVATPTSAKILAYIADYSFNREFFKQNIYELSTSVVNEVAVLTDVHEEESDSYIMIPNPLEDQTALAEIIGHSLETIEFDKNIKVNIEIVMDKDGNLTDVLTDDPEGAQVAATIERQFKNIKFKQFSYEGNPIETRFVIPIQLNNQ